MDKRNGQGCFYHSNGVKDEGMWTDGKLKEEESFGQIVDQRAQFVLTPASNPSEFSYKPRKIVTKTSRNLKNMTPVLSKTALTAQF